MKINMSKTDRLVSILAAMAVVILIYFNIVTGIFAYILLAIAGIFVLTSLVNFCPLYRLLVINTCRVPKKK